MNEQKLKELLEKKSVTPEERIEIAKEATDLAIDILLDSLELNSVPRHIGISAMLTILGRHFIGKGISKDRMNTFFDSIKQIGLELHATTNVHMREE